MAAGNAAGLVLTALVTYADIIHNKVNAAVLDRRQRKTYLSD